MKNLDYLHRKKQTGAKITMLTCYDYPTARLQEEAGLDVIFVGDSVGPNELGFKHEVEVSLDDILHHLKAVRRGVEQAYLLADLPFGTYASPEAALTAARKLIDHGADGVKLEGPEAEIAACLAQHGYEVWGHLGYNPQRHEKAAVQGKRFDTAKALAEDAIALQQAGAQMLVLELVPEELAQLITKQLSIPTIGIGAGRYTDGQVLIVQDMLGITPRPFRHAKPFARLGEQMLHAFREYAREVESGVFPEPVHARNMQEDELLKVKAYFN
ncbi:3-methyl-2-oxobutanoate hydroxymethyltransferase [Cohnella cellulosilytica]|uniref:3-methyl-2-oxobutanoate hydroxymethyltransferase n=1 Tax=Cohnella cellulosilytica TaxID=986710 RepID=A0ABW2FMV6_9BACL